MSVKVRYPETFLPYNETLLFKKAIPLYALLNGLYEYGKYENKDVSGLQQLYVIAADLKTL